MKRAICVTISFMAFAPSVFASMGRYYADRKIQSPNGKYEAEVKTAANQKFVTDDLSITFRNIQSKKTLWRWQKGEKDSGPDQLIPTDNGYLIMLDAWDNYYVFDTNGGKNWVFDPLQALPKDEKEKFIDQNVLWQDHLQQGFLSHENKAYFYIRLYWGKIFILDIAKAKLETNAEITQCVEELILKQTKMLIQNFNGNYYYKCKYCGGEHLRSDLLDAVFVIKQHNILEGKQILNEILNRIEDDRKNYIKEYLDRMVTMENP